MQILYKKKSQLPENGELHRDIFEKTFESQEKWANITMYLSKLRSELLISLLNKIQIYTHLRQPFSVCENHLPSLYWEELEVTTVL